ncbi:Restriction endonuclease, type I, EcoRI, R subunit/Type III [Opitutaceae bacterium TAV5]|nr:Restriction endonuclease, type I, EcoRI, R subunit/Type III [Opitutaceae bacterium TAV5]
MPTIPKRVSDRLAAGIRKFQPVFLAAKNRDVNESDTVVILNDVFAEILGYDKYFEVTSEFAIRGTYCDLAIKLDSKLQILVEVKAVGIDLKDQHVKQAVDYAANQGVEWVILTNGIQWRIYRVIFAKPIDQELVCEFNFLELSPKSEDQLGLLYLITKEGWLKSVMNDFYQQRQALSRFYIGAVLLTEPVLSAIRRELKRVSPDVRIEVDQIETVLKQEVIKRDVLEGDKHIEATRTLARIANRALRAAKTTTAPQPSPASAPESPSPSASAVPSLASP